MVTRKGGRSTDLRAAAQVNIILPIVFFVICVFLAVLPIYVSPVEVGVGVAIVLTGIPVYFLFVYWQNKPLWLTRSSREYIDTLPRLLYENDAMKIEPHTTIDLVFSPLQIHST